MLIFSALESGSKKRFKGFIFITANKEKTMAEEKNIDLSILPKNLKTVSEFTTEILKYCGKYDIDEKTLNIKDLFTQYKNENKKETAYNMFDEFEKFLVDFIEKTYDNDYTNLKSFNTDFSNVLKNTNKLLYNECGSLVRSKDNFNRWIMESEEIQSIVAKGKMEKTFNKYKEFLNLSNETINHIFNAAKTLLQNTDIKEVKQNFNNLFYFAQQLRHSMGTNVSKKFEIWRNIYLWCYSMTKGSGKSTFILSLILAMEKMNLLVDKCLMRDIFGKFNNAKPSKNFLLAIPETKRFNFDGIDEDNMIQMIDKDVYSCEKKGIDIQSLQSMANFIFGSNSKGMMDEDRKAVIHFNERKFKSLDNYEEYADVETLAEAWIELIENIPSPDVLYFNIQEDKEDNIDEYNNEKSVLLNFFEDAKGIDSAIRGENGDTFTMERIYTYDKNFTLKYPTDWRKEHFRQIVSKMIDGHLLKINGKQISKDLIEVIDSKNIKSFLISELEGVSNPKEEIEGSLKEYFTILFPSFPSSSSFSAVKQKKNITLFSVKNEQENRENGESNNQPASKNESDTINKIHINPDTGKEFVLADFYSKKELEEDCIDITKIYQRFSYMSYEEKLELYRQKKEKKEEIIERADKKVKRFMDEHKKRQETLNQSESIVKNLDITDCESQLRALQTTDLPTKKEESKKVIEYASINPQKNNNSVPLKLNKWTKEEQEYITERLKELELLNSKKEVK
jgi:hypothetical protein